MWVMMMAMMIVGAVVVGSLNAVICFLGVDARVELSLGRWSRESI
jgi:hypothetical protein